jgi:hypothetical protein
MVNIMLVPFDQDEVQFPSFTLCLSYLNPYCLGRITAFFFSGHLNFRTAPATGLPSREKKS